MTKDHNKQPEFEEKIIQISRVSKKTKGGNKIGFSVLMVVGDKKGRVGVALGKAPDVASSIRKGVKKAKKRLITVPLNGTTIPFEIEIKKGAGRVLLKPAPKGSGVIAGGPVRAVVEAAGVRDISSKILGSQNQASSVYATFAALREIARIVELKNIKLKSLSEVENQEERLLVEKSQKVVKIAKPVQPVAKKTVNAPKKIEKKVEKKVLKPARVKASKPKPKPAKKNTKKTVTKTK